MVVVAAGQGPAKMTPTTTTTLNCPPPTCLLGFPVVVAHCEGQKEKEKELHKLRAVRLNWMRKCEDERGRKFIRLDVVVDSDHHHHDDDDGDGGRPPASSSLAGRRLEAYRSTCCSFGRPGRPFRRRRRRQLSASSRDVLSSASVRG